MVAAASGQSWRQEPLGRGLWPRMRVRERRPSPHPTTEPLGRGLRPQRTQAKPPRWPTEPLGTCTGSHLPLSCQPRGPVPGCCMAAGAGGAQVPNTTTTVPESRGLQCDATPGPRDPRGSRKQGAGACQASASRHSLGRVRMPLLAHSPLRAALSQAPSAPRATSLRTCARREQWLPHPEGALHPSTGRAQGSGGTQWGPCAHGWPSEKGGFTAAAPRITKPAHNPNTCRLVKRPTAGKAVPAWLSPGSHCVEVSTRATGGLGVSQPPEAVCHCQAHTPDARRQERARLLGEDGNALTTVPMAARPCSPTKNH